MSSGDRRQQHGRHAARSVHIPPAAAKPPESVIAEMRRQGDEVFDHYFGAAEPEPAPGNLTLIIPQVTMAS